MDKLTKTLVVVCIALQVAGYVANCVQTRNAPPETPAAPVSLLVHYSEGTTTPDLNP